LGGTGDDRVCQGVEASTLTEKDIIRVSSTSWVGVPGGTPFKVKQQQTHLTQTLERRSGAETFEAKFFTLT
jgi:hypothetical protein